MATSADDEEDSGVLYLHLDGETSDTGYVMLPRHLGKGVHNTRLAQSIQLSELLPGLKGAEITLDVDVDGHILGIEVMLD